MVYPAARTDNFNPLGNAMFSELPMLPVTAWVAQLTPS
jgi:hypothetical protein